MTGTAYRRSAELAGVVGPYDGYARNAEAHKRVMRKHAAANDAIRTGARHGLATCTELATKAWAASASDRREERLAQRAGQSCSRRPGPSAS